MDIAAMELHHLRSFVTVVEQRSFRAAALQLHVSQPPLSRQIRQLEERLGVSLLIRKPRGIELTDAGTVFFDEAKNILALAAQAANRTQLAGHGQIGRLDIGVFGSAMFNTIPRIIREFRSRYPRVLIALHNMDRDSQTKALRERRLTVGINRLFPDQPDLTSEVIQTERLHVALHDQHPLAARNVLGLADISDQVLILYPHISRPSFIDYILRLFYERGISPSRFHEVDDLTTAVTHVASGFGLSMVTESACSLRMPNIVYVPIRSEDRAILNLCMIYRSNDESKLLHAFLDVARNFDPECLESTPR